MSSEYVLEGKLQRSLPPGIILFSMKYLHVKIKAEDYHNGTFEI